MPTGAVIALMPELLCTSAWGLSCNAELLKRLIDFNIDAEQKPRAVAIQEPLYDCSETYMESCGVAMCFYIIESLGWLPETFQSGVGAGDVSACCTTSST